MKGMKILFCEDLIHTLLILHLMHCHEKFPPLVVLLCFWHTDSPAEGAHGNQLDSFPSLIELLTV